MANPTPPDEKKYVNQSWTPGPYKYYVECADGRKYAYADYESARNFSVFACRNGPRLPIVAIKEN